MSNHAASPPGSSIVEMRGITISFPGVLALDDVDFTPARRRDPLAHGRERRRQVHPHQGADRRVRRSTAGTITVAGEPRRLPHAPPTPRPPASRRCTRRSTSAPTCRSARTSCSATSRAAAVGIDWKGAHRAGRRAPREASACRSTPARCCPATRSPSSSWSRSAAPWCSTPGCSSSTSRPRASTAARSSSCSRVIRDLRDRGRRHPVRQPLPRPGLRDLRPHHGAAQRPAGRRVPRPRTCPATTLVTKMIGRELDDLAAISRGLEPRRSTASGAPVLRGHGRRAPRRARAGRPRRATTARSSASPACSAPAAPSSSACSTAPTAPTPGRSRSTASPSGSTSPRHAIDQRHRVLVRGPPRRGHRRRPHRRREHRARHPGPARLAAQASASAEQDAVVAEYIEALDVRPADPELPWSATSRAATSRRCCSPAGWRPLPSCSSSTSPPAASTSARRPTSSARSPSCRQQGLSVIFISSELEEVLRLAQRVVVMRDRRKIGELDSDRRRLGRPHRLHRQRRRRERRVKRCREASALLARSPPCSR